MLSFAAIKGGSVGLQGATSGVLERSLIGLRDLINRALADVRLIAGVPVHLDDIELDQLVADVQVSANLEAMAKGCQFSVSRGKVESMFEPFEQHHADRTGLGLGLSIARKAIESSGGRLSVRNKPGFGCVFTIDFPRRMTLRATG